MPDNFITPDEKRELLSSFGYSDATHDVDSNLNIIPKAQPAVSNVNPTAITAKPVPSAKQFGMGETIGRNAATSVLPSGVGLTAGIAATEASLPLAGVPVVGPFLPPTIGLISGLLASYGSGKAQEKVLNSTDVGREFNENTALASQQNPGSAVLGNLAGSLPFLKPDLRMAKNGVQALLGANGAREALSNPAIQQMLIGGGVGAGQGLYDEATSDRPFSPTALGANIIGGAVMSPRSHALNRGLGLHPYTPEVMNTVYENGVPANNVASAVTAKPTSTTSEVPFERPQAKPPRGKLTREGEIIWKDKPDYIAEAGRKAENQRDEKFRPVPAEQLNTLEAEGGPVVGDKQLEVEKQRLEDFKKAKEEVEVEKQREVELANEEALQLKLKNDLTEANLRAGLTAEGRPEPRVTTESGKEIHNDYTGNLEQDAVANANETPADLAHRKLEGHTGDKYQTAEQQMVEADKPERTFKSPLERQLFENAELKRVSGERNAALAAKRGVEVVEHETPTIKLESGKEVYGKANVGNRKVEQTNTRSDTGFHEQAHIRYSELSPEHRSRLERVIKSDKDAQEWMKKNNASAEEYIVQAAGEDDAKRILNKDSNLSRDLTSWLRVKLGKATKEDVVRHLTNKTNFAGKYDGVVTPTVKPVNVKQQPVNNSEKEIRYLGYQKGFGKIPGYSMFDVFENGKKASTLGERQLKAQGMEVPPFVKGEADYKAAIAEHGVESPQAKEMKKAWEAIGDRVRGDEAAERGLEYQGKDQETIDRTPFKTMREEVIGKDTPEPTREELKGGAEKDRVNNVGRVDRYQEVNQSSASDDNELKRIHVFDQFQGKINKKVEEGMRLWHESDIKVGDIFYTAKGTPVEIISAGIRTDKNGKQLIYGKTPRGDESSFYLDKLTPSDDDGTPIKFQNKDVTPAGVDTSKRGFANFLTSTFDKVAPVNKHLSEAFKNWETRMSQHLGLRNVAVNELSKFTPQEVNDTLAYHRAKFRNEEPTTTPNEGVSKSLKEYFGEFRNRQIQAGLKINGREAGKNEWYVPDMMSDKSIDLFTRKASSPEALYAKKEWAKYIVDESNGKIKYADAFKDVNDYVEALGNPRDNYHSINFGALRRAQGYGLPETLREVDPAKIVNKYGKRASRDLAMYQELESKPEIAKMLNLRDPNTGDMPVLKEGETSLSSDPKVRDAMKWVMNSFEGATNPQISSLVRVVNNSLLGAGTGLRDLVSVPVNTLPYINKFSDLSAFWRGMTDWRKNNIESLRTNARNNNLDSLNWGEVLEAPDRFTAAANKTADAMRKYQGRELLEQTSRIWTYGIGKELATNAVASNNKRFLDTFGRLAKKENGEWNVEQLSKNFVDRVQGGYGGSGLPVGTMEGSFAPFLTLQKWGIEKSNVIYQDVVKPALSGQNYLPILSYTLGSILTGAGIQELNKILSNRKGQDATIKETAAIPTASNVTAELATLMQLGSFAGIVGDSLKALSDTALVGKTPRNIVSFPTATFASELGERTVDLTEALRQGEDKWETLKSFILDTLVGHVQNARLIANNTFNKDDSERSEKFRDLRVFKTLSGEPVADASAAEAQNKYLNPEVRKFKQSPTLNSAVEIVPEILERFAEKAKENPTKALEFLKSVKGNNYQTLPNPDNFPEQFARYWNFLKDSQGEEVAYKRVVDYFKQKGINEVKSSMIP